MVNSLRKLDMVKLNFDPGPLQEPITLERIKEMITWVPRRFRLADIDRPLKAPGDFSPDDWNLMFPFRESFVPAFEVACRVDHIPFKRTTGPSCFTFLKEVTDEEIEEIKEWVDVIKPYVAIRDCLTLSFALDYDRGGGDPDEPRTRIGALRERAKIYDMSRPTSETYKAADKLVQESINFLTNIGCYDLADAVVAMPPSRPDKPFDLPTYLAEKIAEEWGRTDLSSAVRTVKERPPMKDTLLEDKLEALEGTIEVDHEPFEDEEKVILLVDDLYQSGVSMNYVAMLLLEAGAKKVYGLACEKTCSNDDNISRRGS